MPDMNRSEPLENRLEYCRRLIDQSESLVVGFSGGVDSTLLTALAVDVLGADRVLAVTASGAIFPAGDSDRCRELAQTLGTPWLEAPVEVLAETTVRENPADRCYHCKRMIFQRLREIASKRNMAAVASGSNADDAPEDRPGMRAECELQIARPLAEAGLGKEDIRRIARRMGLPNADRPAEPCLATRIPYGETLSVERLQRVDAAERVLREMSLIPCRVRDHGRVARLELPAELLPTALTQRDEIARRLKQCGYVYVALDLQGLRSGSMNDSLPPETPED
jgi:uncharacterized protein